MIFDCTMMIHLICVYNLDSSIMDTIAGCNLLINMYDNILLPHLGNCYTHYHFRISGFM